LLLFTYNIRGDYMIYKIWRALKEHIFIIIFIFCILIILFSLLHTWWIDAVWIAGEFTKKLG